MEVIKVENLYKSYVYYEKQKGVVGSLKNIFRRKMLTKEAVNNISFSVERGDFVGFIGLNGAGKTTTLKMLSGILKPSSGSIKVEGFIPFDKKPELLRQIAMVMGNKSQLWWDIPSMDSFELNRQIFEVDKKKYKEVLDDLVETLNVKHLLKIQVRRLSLGERMKMELISALIHSPSILFLDEPTIGLDIISQYNIRKFLRYYNEKYKTTIILTSHNFGDIEHLCDRLLLIDQGRIIDDKKFDEFVKQYSNRKVLTIKLTEGTNDILSKIKRYNYDKLYEGINELKISVNEEEIISLTNDLTSNYFSDLKDISIENLDIEEIVREIYSGGKKEG
jgi:ABC-2 type transport system ATP-binding protein